MKTLRELEELELMQRATNLKGQALSTYYDANCEKGEAFVKRHEVARSCASFCLEIDKYLAEMRFSRLYERKTCYAMLRDVQRIEKLFGDDCETVVHHLMEQMKVQLDT